MAKAKSQITSVGDFSLVLSHPLVNGGQSIALSGFKVEGDIVDSDQEIDNAKVVPLIGQIVAIITNNIKAGVLRFSAIRGNGDVATGDMVAISHALINLGDAVGGTVRASWTQNGSLVAVTLYTVVVKRCPPLRMAGNDVAPYPIEWAYGDYSDE